MTIAMTLVVPDETGLLEAQLDFHLSAGVDVIVVTDAGRTPAMLERYVERGAVHIARGSVTELAANELGAEWVIGGDANEFWWPRGGSLKDVLAPVPSRYGMVQAVVRHFVPVPDDGRPFSERMIYRLAAFTSTDPESPWRPLRKEVRRVATGGELVPLRGWYPIEVLHFPMVSGAELEETEQALANGVLQVDTRLRDALRSLPDSTPAFPRSSVVEDALFAADVAVLGEADVLHAQQRLDELERRLHALESSAPARVERKLRAFVRRR